MNTLALLPNLAGPDMIIIFVIVLIMFGAKKLPEFAKGLGQAVREFSKAKDSVNQELNTVTHVMDHDPYHHPVHPPVETHALPNPAAVSPAQPAPAASPGAVSIAKPESVPSVSAPAQVAATQPPTTGSPIVQDPVHPVHPSPVASSSPVPEALKPKV